jgi:hypothetical protein
VVNPAGPDECTAGDYMWCAIVDASVAEEVAGPVRLADGLAVAAQAYPIGAVWLVHAATAIGAVRHLC